MIVRSISFDEINEFCRIGRGEEDARKFKEKMVKALDEKRSYLEWCFVVEDGGKFISRLAFDILPSEPLNLMVWGFYVPEGQNYLNIGEKLFKGAIEQFKCRGIKLIEYHLYGNEDKKFNEQRDLLLTAGFEIQQEKKNYQFAEGKLPELSGRLQYKSLSEVGELECINVIKRVTEKTLDTYDKKDVKEFGAEEAARKYFYGLKDIDFNEDWWKLAYENNGDIAGLIIPHRFSMEYGAINYIGVVPEKRGRGYVKDLLIIGTSILKEDGIKKIIADIDINNFPMENALKSVGYELKKKELVLEIRF